MLVPGDSCKFCIRRGCQFNIEVHGDIPNLNHNTFTLYNRFYDVRCNTKTKCILFKPTEKGILDDKKMIKVIPYTNKHYRLFSRNYLSPEYPFYENMDELEGIKDISIQPGYNLYNNNTDFHNLSNNFNLTKDKKTRSEACKRCTYRKDDCTDKNCIVYTGIEVKREGSHFNRGYTAHFHRYKGIYQIFYINPFYKHIYDSKLISFIKSNFYREVKR